VVIARSKSREDPVQNPSTSSWWMNIWKICQRGNQGVWFWSNYRRILGDGRDTLKQSYPPKALDRRLQEDWARDAREGPRVVMSLMVDFELVG